MGVIDRVRPRWVIVENVRGAPVEVWSEQLAALGYVTSWALLDAADWGLPSHRRRLFVVAGPVGYRWPTPTHYGPDVPWLLRGGRQPWVGFGQALGLDDQDHYYPFGVTSTFQPDPIDPRRPALCLNTKANQYVVRTGKMRRLHVWQSAILLGFPEGYPFQGSKQAQHRQIGNAVAPIMAEVLARGLTGDDSGCKV